MNHSEFLKTFGVGFGGMILPESSFFHTEVVKIYDNYVRGLQYYEFGNQKKSIKEGDELILKRDPENVYDSFAIIVCFREYRLGYIAAYENIVLANMLDQGIRLFSKASKVDINDSYFGLAIEVSAELVKPSDKLISMMNAEQRADDFVDVYRKGGFEI